MIGSLQELESLLREFMLTICAGMQKHCIPPPEARLMANRFSNWLASQI